MRVLVIQTAFLGDMILTLPLIDLLRSSGVASSVVALAAPAGAAFLETQDVVGDLIVFDKRDVDAGPGGTLRVARLARELEPEIALVPHRSFRSAAIAALAGVARRVGFDESGGRPLLTETVAYRRYAHEIERVASLATAVGAAMPEGRVPFHVRVPAEAVADAIDELSKAGVPADFAVLAPGSRWATKRWPADRYAALADRILEGGRGVVLVGGDADRAVAGEVAARASDDVVDLSGRLGIGGWLAVMERAAAVVSNDSAAAHVAAGVGTPVVAVFGPTVPEQGFAPYADRARVVAAEVACRPCGRHGAERCQRGTLECMLDVGVADVETAMRELTQERG